VRDTLFLDLKPVNLFPILPFCDTIACFKQKKESSRNEKPCLSFPVIAMNATSLRRDSRFVRADACCRVVLNALFFYSSMVLVAEISAFIIYAVNVMRDALRGALLSPRKEVLSTFQNLLVFL